MKADKLILGVLGGVAIGALVGVLFAPDKGTKTRRKIVDKGFDYADDFKDKFDTLLDAMTKKYEKVWNQGEDLIAEGKTKFNSTKKDIEKINL